MMEISKEDIDLVRLALSVYHTRTVYPGCVEAFERLITKTTENVTCEKLSNADERQAALDNFIGFDRTFDGRETFQLSEKTIDTIRASLQSPRVTVIDDKQAMEASFKELYGIPMSTAFRQWDNEKIAQNFIHGWRSARAYAELQKWV
jgi:hypothetical protein